MSTTSKNRAVLEISSSLVPILTVIEHRYHLALIRNINAKITQVEKHHFISRVHGKVYLISLIVLQPTVFTFHPIYMTKKGSLIFNTTTTAIKEN